jgi:uncharacterized protein YnzC (UPF0291/DUF896 family)
MLIKKCGLWSLSVILCLLLAACEDESSQDIPQIIDTEKEPPKSTAIRPPQQSDEGDCANFDFSPYMQQDGKLDLSIQLRVLRDMAKVYPSAQAQQPNKTLLAFSTPLRHGGELSDERIKVTTLEHDDPLGWVSLNDLLCTNRPIINPEKGLEKKFYIKTKIQQRKQGEPSAFINAYPMPAEQCHDKCRQLSRFTMYFIVDQEKDWYLLADDYHLKHPLVGWVRKKDGYLWDTAYGLRPRDDLEYKGNVGAECVYQTLDNAINKHHCMPVLGGKSWYQEAVRIPLLDIVDHNGNHIKPKGFADTKGGQDAFYKVALAVPGVGLTKDFKITSKSLREPSINLASMKFIDVFFLIDGTASMQPVIDLIRGIKGAPGLVQNIANTLRKAPDFKDSKIRFGFRVYRDSYAGKKELGDGLPLRAEHCEELPDDYLEKNRKNFQDRIADVQASVDDKGIDDYPENLFGGLKQVLQDLRSCPGHTKLLFVIGDHGYDKEVLSMNNLQELISKLKRDKGRLVTFFIQMPNQARTAKTPDAYNRAYDLYCSQGYEFLQAVLEGKKSRSKDDYNYLIRLQDNASSSPRGFLCGQWKPLPFNQLGNNILEGIRGFSKSSILSELTVDLRGGKALKTAIEHLRQKHTDVPGLFWDFIEEGNCETLGKQCNEQVYDITFEGYIPVSNDISLDVWMTGNQLLDFKQNVLRIFRKLGPIMRESAKREQIVTTIAETLKIQIMEPEIEPDETYADYLQRKGGLPVSRNSLLLSYTPEQLEDENKVPDCELDRLAVLATNMETILGIIYEGNYRPHFKTKPYPESTCTKASENGKRIPFIRGRISKKRLGDDDTYRYDHEFRGKIIYWVPQEYLP